MPDPIEPQLDELRRKARRRLIGAVVLALAAAVLVPMLLESDPKPLGEDVSVKIPPVDDSKFVSRLGDKGKAPDKAADAKPAAEAPKVEPLAPTSPPVAPSSAAKEAAAVPPPPSRSLAQAEQRVISPGARPLPAEAAAPAGPKLPVAESAKAAEPAKASESARSADAPQVAEPAKSAESSRPPETTRATDAPKAAEPAKAASGAYSVQLAAFTDDKGANALAAKLKKAGHPSYIEPYETSRGRVWRVRVGPYPSREAADAARAKLRTEGHSGILAAAK
jgi:DedD protein